MRFSWRKSRNSTLRNILEEILGDRFSYRFDISSAILLAPGKTSNLSFTIFSERDIFISRQKSIGKVKIYLLVCYIPTYSRYSPRGDVINYRTSRRLTSPINYRGKELLFSAVSRRGDHLLLSLSLTAASHCAPDHFDLQSAYFESLLLLFPSNNFSFSMLCS